MLKLLDTIQAPATHARPIAETGARKLFHGTLEHFGLVRRPHVDVSFIEGPNARRAAQVAAVAHE